MAPGCLHYGNLEGLVLLPGPIERGKQVSLRHPSRVPLKEIWAVYVLLLQLQSIYLTLQILPTCFSVKYLRFPPPQYLSDSSEGDNSLWTCFHPIFGNIKKYLWVYIFPLILLFPEDLAIPRDSLRGSGAHLKPLFGLPSLSSQIRGRSGSLFNKDAFLALSLGEKGKETLYPWGV